MREFAPSLYPRVPKPVLVLGTDAVASAVGHALASIGIAAVMMRDPQTPVLRRGMSFDDALETSSARLDGITAYAVALSASGDMGAILGVTDMHIHELLDPALVGGVIDARMRSRPPKTDLRGRLDFAIGLGPGFVAGQNVDMAVDTPPPPPGRGQFATAPRTGLWWTFREIGEALEAGAVVGLCGGMQVPTPLTGALCGLVRRGTEVTAGAPLLEIDPTRPAAPCHGIDPDAATIAAACVAALRGLWTRPRVTPPSETV